MQSRPVMHQNTRYLGKDAKKVLLKLIKPTEKIKVRGDTGHMNYLRGLHGLYCLHCLHCLLLTILLNRGIYADIYIVTAPWE